MMGRRIAVTGGRNFNDEQMVRNAFNLIRLSRSDTLVHGACSGADALCARIAGNAGVPVEAHPADWKAYGRAAGPIRNRQMLESGIDLLIAFPGGRGTDNCASLAGKMGIALLDLRDNTKTLR